MIHMCTCVHIQCICVSEVMLTHYINKNHFWKITKTGSWRRFQVSCDAWWTLVTDSDMPDHERQTVFSPFELSAESIAAKCRQAEIWRKCEFYSGALTPCLHLVRAMNWVDRLRTCVDEQLSRAVVMVRRAAVGCNCLALTHTLQWK